MAPSEGVPHFADRLNDLFGRVPRTGTTVPYSNDAVAAELTDRGVSVTGVYLGQLRSGRKANPSARLVGGLATFFGVSVTYFFDDDEAGAVRDQLDKLAILRDSSVRGVMTRTQGISEAGIEHLLGIIEHIRKLEGLDNETH